MRLQGTSLLNSHAVDDATTNPRAPARSTRPPAAEEYRGRSGSGTPPGLGRATRGAARRRRGWTQLFDVWLGRRGSSAVRRFVAFQAVVRSFCFSGLNPRTKIPPTLSACPAFTRFLSAFVSVSQFLLRPIKLTLVVVVAWTATQPSLNHGWASRARRRPCHVYASVLQAASPSAAQFRARRGVLRVKATCSLCSGSL